MKHRVADLQDEALIEWDKFKSTMNKTLRESNIHSFVHYR
jgi:hypothetical protein